MTMLEKMARAMFAWCHDETWEQAEELTRGIYLDDARAALKALKEPSEEAMRAAEQTDSMKFVATALLQAKNHGMGELPEGTCLVRDVWQVMITAILEGRG